MPRTSLPAIRANNTQAQLSALAVKLNAKETELASLDHDRTTEPSVLIRKRATLKEEISRLREEEQVLKERLALENADQASREHRAKCKRVEAALQVVYDEFRRLDDLLEQVGRSATAIRRIYAQELMPEISGIDSAFAVSRADWMRWALVKLASLGLGNDGRFDRSAEVPDILDRVRDHHATILAELRDRPMALKAERERQQAEWATLGSATNIGGPRL